jgi:hypothetical protein
MTTLAPPRRAAPGAGVHPPNVVPISPGGRGEDGAFSLSGRGGRESAAGLRRIGRDVRALGRG